MSNHLDDRASQLEERARELVELDQEQAEEARRRLQDDADFVGDDDDDHKGIRMDKVRQQQQIIAECPDDFSEDRRLSIGLDRMFDQEGL